MNQNTHDNFPSQKILKFWFEESKPEQWFVSGEKFDLAIQQKFASIAIDAEQHKYSHDNLDDYGKLALIIVLDQFFRNIYRGTPRAFAGDSQALELTKLLLSSSAHETFSMHEKTFLYMPLEHSEVLEDQNLSVELFGKLGNADFLHYAILHRDIIERFGRFPHRNEILGRESSKEELEFLQQPNSSF